jgi:aminoglycoside phosphotransferase (APT) family kinase protein
MTAGRMHADDVPTDAWLVRRLLAGQLPAWAELPISPVPSAGTENARFRLGDEIVVRLPRIHWAVEQVEKEQRWLSLLAPHLPLAIPTPLAMGEPAEGYPWRGSVYPWLAGRNPTHASIPDPCKLAVDLALFVAAPQRVDATGGPPPGSHNVRRGGPLARRDAATRTWIESLHGEIDIEGATAAWKAALQAPPTRAMAMGRTSRYS